MMVIPAAGSLVFTGVGKTVVSRARPPLELAVPPYEYTPSFPSGHTLNSTVIALMLAHLAWWLSENLWVRVISPVLGAVRAAAMGLGRVYLGHHWLTDVIVGWVVGLAWLAPSQSKRQHRRPTARLRFRHLQGKERCRAVLQPDQGVPGRRHPLRQTCPRLPAPASSWLESSPTYATSYATRPGRSSAWLTRSSLVTPDSAKDQAGRLPEGSGLPPGQQPGQVCRLNTQPAHRSLLATIHASRGECPPAVPGPPVVAGGAAFANMAGARPPVVHNTTPSHW